MSSTAEIIRAAEALPVRERTIVVDSLLRSLNSPSPDVDRKWANVAKHRLSELRSGTVKPVLGEDVLTRISQRFDV